jgi:hypothetical protein
VENDFLNKTLVLSVLQIQKNKIIFHSLQAAAIVIQLIFLQGIKLSLMFVLKTDRKPTFISQPETG